jgi:hypothetical protein
MATFEAEVAAWVRSLELSVDIKNPKRRAHDANGIEKVAAHASHPARAKSPTRCCE